MQRNALLSPIKEGARVHRSYGSYAPSTYGSYEPRRANPSTAWQVPPPARVTAGQLAVLASKSAFMTGTEARPCPSPASHRSILRAISRSISAAAAAARSAAEGGRARRGGLKQSTFCVVHRKTMITMGSLYFVWINTNKIISSWYLLDAVCVTPRARRPRWSTRSAGRSSGRRA